MEIEQFIEGMPKAELHMHIEGVLEPEQKFELAARNSLELPYDTVDEVIASYDFDDLSTFLASRYEGDGVLITERDFYELGMAYFERVAAENLVYAEIFFDPQAHTTRGVDFATVIEGLHRSQADAAGRLGIESELIMCFLRDLSAESAAEALEQAEPYREWIIGIGLDSDERGNPPSKFADVFGQAADQGYRLTMHCDVDQENSVANIWQALDEIGVERIDHGINSLEDDALVDTLVGSRDWPHRMPGLERFRRAEQQVERHQDDARPRHAGQCAFGRSRILPGLHEREPQGGPTRRHS